jgi:DNA polymerase V
VIAPVRPGWLSGSGSDRLMAAMDNLNRKLSPDAVKFGALDLKPTWSMRSEYFSQRYTTPWGELPTVRTMHCMQSEK